MTNRKIILVALSILLIIFFAIKLFDYLSHRSELNRVIDEIESSFKGIAIDKFSYRENDLPTHLKIKSNDSIFEITPFPPTIRKAELGDSVIKPRDENYVILKRNDSIIFNHYYKRISNEIRNDSDFPKKWRKKWLESS